MFRLFSWLFLTRETCKSCFYGRSFVFSKFASVCESLRIFQVSGQENEKFCKCTFYQEGLCEVSASLSSHTFFSSLLFFIFFSLAVQDTFLLSQHTGTRRTNEEQKKTTFSKHPLVLMNSCSLQHVTHVVVGECQRQSLPRCESKPACAGTPSPERSENLCPTAVHPKLVSTPVFKALNWQKTQQRRTTTTRRNDNNERERRTPPTDGSYRSSNTYEHCRHSAS